MTPVGRYFSCFPLIFLPSLQGGKGLQHHYWRNGTVGRRIAVCEANSGFGSTFGVARELGRKNNLQPTYYEVKSTLFEIIFFFRALKRCCFDGYLRANDADIYLPYSGDSQVVATGQWDILSGPLTLKGNT